MMQEEWIVENNSSFILNISKHSLILDRGRNRSVDLVKFTGMTIEELERDKDIMREINNNNLITVKKTSKNDLFENSKDIEEMRNKIDRLIDIILEKDKNPELDAIAKIVEEKINEAVNKIEIPVVEAKAVDRKKRTKKEDEIFREEALKTMVDNSKIEKQNMSNFGKDKKVVDPGEDFSDLLN